MRIRPHRIPDVGRPPQRAAADVTSAVLTMVCCPLPVFLVGTLAVELRSELHFGAAALGALVTLYYLGAAVFSIPLSWLVDRGGALRAMRIAPLCSAVLLVVLAVCASSWAWLAVLLVPCGMASAATGTATNQFLARRLPLRRQGLAFGIKQAAVPVSSLLGGLAVPAVALTLGWRWAFGIAAVLAACAGLLVPAPTTTLAARRRERQLRPPGTLSLPPLIALGLGAGLGLFAASGLAAFLVTAGVNLGMTQAAAAIVAAVASATAAVTRVGLGALVDRRSNDHFVTVAGFMMAGVVGYAVLVDSSVAGTKTAFVIGAIAALGIGWGWNGLFNLAVVRSQDHAPARTTGVTQVGGRLGALLGPLVIGLLVDHASYTAAWTVAAAAGMAGAAAILFGRHLSAAHLSKEDT